MARQITLAGRPLSYETEVIRYTIPAKQHRYTPDFVLMKKDGSPMFIEGKGLFETKDRQKHLFVREQYPDHDIRFVFSNAKNRISKTSKTTYADWCEAKGFLYADKGIIPAEWFNE